MGADLMKRFFVFLIPLILLVSVSCSYNGQSNVVYKDARIEVNPASFDFGDIKQSDGVVTALFSVQNTGGKPLKINRLSTSCGCTTAKMEMSDIQPGEKRDMVVSFDPMVHPDQFGPIIRVVYLQTSDPETPELEIDIKGYVVK